MINKENNKEELLDLDDAEYSHKSEFSKPAVIQTQVMRCNDLRSKEMVEGHTIRTFDKAGNYKLIDVPDTRQPFIGGVIALRTNLAPEIIREEESEEETKIDIDKIDEQKELLFEKYKHRELCLTFKDNKPILIYSGNEYIPKKGAILVNSVSRSSGRPPTENKVEGLWDNKISAYWDDMVLLYDKLFAELNILIDINEYFKPVSGW